MALVTDLVVGFQYRMHTGIYEGRTVTILDKEPFPDYDKARRRKITVQLEGDGEADAGQVVYVLPRMIDDRPVGIEDAALPAGIEYSSAPVVPVDEVVIPDGEVTVTVERDGVTEEKVVDGGLLKLGIKPITDPMDPRLDQFRPKKSEADSKHYKRRTMKNGMTDVEFLLQFSSDTYRSHNQGYPMSFLLKGDTQSGKTMLIRVLAVEWSKYMAEQQKARGEKVTFTKPMPVFTIQGSAGVTEYDLFGQPANYTDPVTGKSVIVHLPGLIELACMAGGLLMWDEANAVPERVSVTSNALLDFRHEYTNPRKPTVHGGIVMAEHVRAPLDLWVCGALNDAGYQGMGKLNEAFKNRFVHIEWDYDTSVESELIKSEAIRHLGESLRTARKSDPSIRTPVGTSQLQKMEVHVNALGIEMGIDLIVAMFEPNERQAVRTIIDHRSIKVLLEQEQKRTGATPVQAASEDMAEALGLNIKPPAF